MSSRIGLRLLGVLLVCDSVAGGLGASRALHAALAGDWRSVVVVIGRLVSGGTELIAGWGVLADRGPAREFAPAALLSSAVMTSLEVGAGVAPGALSPLARWATVAGAWIFAAAWIGYLRRVDRQHELADHVAGFEPRVRGRRLFEGK